MHGSLRAAFCATPLCLALELPAATVFRCEDSAGHITFTAQGCPNSHSQTLQNAHNPSPGSGKPVPLASPQRMQTRRAAKGNPPLVVVGEQDDGCGNRLSGSARREAMIRQEVRPGMTLRDVESSLGKPDKISSQNGQIRYQYRSPEGRSRQVNFDENGCVKGKR
ncbi:MAG: DUF4124 domain-containing protein [Pseudomonadota bacterium]